MRPSLHHDYHCSIKWIGRFAGKGGHADVVIDCAGAKLSSNQGLYMLKPADGRLVLVALFEQQPELDVNHVVRTQVTIHGSWAWTGDNFRRAIDFVQIAVSTESP
jgi:threonine dehydrogenase-like Zn-dependent dehydrogenase